MNNLQICVKIPDLCRTDRADCQKRFTNLLSADCNRIDRLCRSGGAVSASIKVGLCPTNADDCLQSASVASARPCAARWPIAETIPYIFHGRQHLGQRRALLVDGRQSDSEKCPLPQKRNPSPTRKSGRSHFFDTLPDLCRTDRVHALVGQACCDAQRGIIADLIAEGSRDDLAGAG